MEEVSETFIRTFTQETDSIRAYLIYDSQKEMIFIELELELTYFIKTEWSIFYC